MLPMMMMMMTMASWCAMCAEIPQPGQPERPSTANCYTDALARCERFFLIRNSRSGSKLGLDEVLMDLRAAAKCSLGASRAGD